MLKLNLPLCKLNTRISASSHQNDVFDVARKRWVTLTPEEWVRQSFIHYMVNSLNYPLTHISVEQSFLFENGKPQRADIIVYDNNGKPLILIECKAPKVKITADIFTQATRYNVYIKAKYIVVTNGLSHYILSTDNFTDYSYEKEMPCYRQK